MAIPNKLKTNPLISILVPCYNVEKFVEQCITSICKQTYPHIEILCINDGSTDSTLTILQRCAFWLWSFDECRIKGSEGNLYWHCRV